MLQRSKNVRRSHTHKTGSIDEPGKGERQHFASTSIQRKINAFKLVRFEFGDHARLQVGRNEHFGFGCTIEPQVCVDT